VDRTFSLVFRLSLVLTFSYDSFSVLFPLENLLFILKKWICLAEWRLIHRRQARGLIRAISCWNLH
jgi:hypothetical protein